LPPPPPLFPYTTLFRSGQFKKTKVLGICPNGGTTVLNTSTGEITTQKTVIAAGAFSAQLTEQLGDKIPLQQERGYHLTLSEYARSEEHTSELQSRFDLV